MESVCVAMRATAMDRIQAETNLKLSKAKVCSMPAVAQSQRISIPEFKARLAACKTKQERLEVCYDVLSQDGYMGGPSDDQTIIKWREGKHDKAA